MWKCWNSHGQRSTAIPAIFTFPTHTTMFKITAIHFTKSLRMCWPWSWGCVGGSACRADTTVFSHQGYFLLNSYDLYPKTRPLWVLPRIWGIFRVHLLPAIHSPNFNPIAAIGKKMSFYCFIGSLGTRIPIMATRKTFGADGCRTIFSSAISVASLGAPNNWHQATQ